MGRFKSTVQQPVSELSFISLFDLLIFVFLSIVSPISNHKKKLQMKIGAKIEIDAMK